LNHYSFLVFLQSSINLVEVHKLFIFTLPVTEKFTGTCMFCLFDLNMSV